MTFRPNMTPQQIKEEDTKRGYPLSNKTPITAPALKGVDSAEFQSMGNEEDGVSTEDEEEDEMAYAIPEGHPFGKPLPERKNRKGESQFQHKIRQWTEEVKNKPDRFPGGRDQAIAIAAEQSGVSKAICPVHSPGECPGSCPNQHEYSHMKEAKKSLSAMCTRLQKSTKPVEKALSTRSMHIPRPTSVYDPFNVMNSAQRPITRSQSKIRGPEGVAPLIGETFEQLVEDEKKKTHGEVFKSCVVHGITYRAQTGCHPCRIAKAQTCSGCGSQLMKSVGGAVCCTVCG